MISNMFEKESSVEFFIVKSYVHEKRCQKFKALLLILGVHLKSLWSTISSPQVMSAPYLAASIRNGNVPYIAYTYIVVQNKP
jgi:hypothetical protein